MTRSSRVGFVAVAWIVATGPAWAQGVQVKAPRYTPGAEWTVIELDDASRLPSFQKGWQRSTFWDLRPVAGQGNAVRWTIELPGDVGLDTLARSTGANIARCGKRLSDGASLGCELIDTTPLGPGGRVLMAGDRFTGQRLDDGGIVKTVDGVALAEGIALTPAGPAEVLLVREAIRDATETRTLFRFVSENGRTVAAFDAESGVPVRGSVLAEADRLADDGLTIAYQKLSDSLTPGSIGFLQYSMSFTGVNCLTDGDCGLPNVICFGADPQAMPPVPGSCRAPLSDLRNDWAAITDATGIDLTNQVYLPDPTDSDTVLDLPEVWEFATLNVANLQQRTFNTIRDDTAWHTCLETCASKDQSANPPDGTWQAYLKIDNYDENGAFVTRDIFMFNDNDTGADPSIDVPFVVQDQANASDATQICFEDAGGNAADRLLEFFQFTGADPASAALGVGDAWGSGNWTSCNASNGLALTLASVCDDACYPDCPGSLAAPKARGLFPSGPGVGLEGSIAEDGYLHVAAGNYIPALLLLQGTDLEAGGQLFGTCNISPTRLRGVDWFWIHERYGLMALISGPNDDGNNPCGLIQPDDWSCFDNRTDGADFTWGPFPPYQISAEACLNGTKIDWALPADGSNLTGEPNITDWGYVVSWGTETDPDLLADWNVNPNHTPLPGQGGYLAAPPGSEPTSYVITGWGGSSIGATVTTALRYTDPDAADTLPYRSAAFFRVVEDPARLDPLVFQVGNAVAPFVTKNGNDLDLAWPPVGGASGYSIQVFDLSTGLPIACPAGLDCAPATTTTTFGGGASTAALHGFRVFAVDSCGDPSSN